MRIIYWAKNVPLRALFHQYPRRVGWVYRIFRGKGDID